MPSHITQHYLEIKSRLPEGATLVAVSKTRKIEEIMELYNAGQRVFAENKVQEMVAKHSQLPADIQWHLIGHLQTNKVRAIAAFVHTVESADSGKILEELHQEAARNGRIIRVLLQVKIAAEDTKYGLHPGELDSTLKKYSTSTYKNIEIKGLMGMATFTEDQAQIRKEFYTLKHLYDEFSTDYNFETLSMGMSGDYPLALECGANAVRIGSAIFGERAG